MFQSGVQVQANPVVFGSFGTLAETTCAPGLLTQLSWRAHASKHLSAHSQVSMMLQDHAADIDMCLVGEKVSHGTVV